MTNIVKHRDTSLNIIYGYKCNYSCVGCCNGSDYVRSVSYDPDLDTILSAIEVLPSYIEIDPSGMITMLGGEPFMYWPEKIVPIARALRKQYPTAKLNIFTNGHLIYKYADEVIELMKELSINLTISQHLLGDLNSPLGQHWKKNVLEFCNNPKVHKIHDEHYHIIGHLDANIYLYKDVKWFTWYKETGVGMKPYASGDPEKSMKYGCASGSACTSLFGSRIYKCGSLAMLPGLLAQRGQLSDADWAKYLDYPYIDLLDVNSTKFENFKQTYNQPITQCDMCNDNPANIIGWTGRSENMILQKR